jgi:glycosyltransferase involved in cell wall biosynthesis
MLRRWHIDVLHAHDIYTNIFSTFWVRLFTRCAIIASRRWWRRAPRPGLATLNRWSYLFAHRILANSCSVAGLLANDEGVAPGKIVEIPNFLEESAFERVDEALGIAQRRAWGVPDDAFVIGTVARLAPVKNHALLLRAAAQLDSRYHLVLVGDGPSRAELEGFSRQLEIESRVHFAGEVVSRINLNQFFDVSVLCSLSEGFPNSLIEAFAAGRPVVATPVGGVMDVVKEGVTGLLVPSDDPAQLADAMRKLEADCGLRTRLGEAGRELVRNKFHKDIVIEKLSALYEKLADRRRVA